MILAVDAGNTNIVFGGIDSDQIYFTERLATDYKKTSTEYAILIKNVLDFRKIEVDRIEGCIISSVVPPLNAALSDSLERVTGKKVMLVGPGIKTGLKICIDDPATAGADLVVGAVAAKKLYQDKWDKPMPIILIDIGTATTMVVLNEKGAFLGGTIVPGPRASMEALATGTAQLPAISLNAPKKVVATNTIDCMRSGIIYGHIAMIDGIIDMISEEQQKDFFVLATGGQSRFVTPFCRHKIVFDEDLLLKGLSIIYYKNV